jgi:hypothetical protein
MTLYEEDVCLWYQVFEDILHGATRALYDPYVHHALANRIAVLGRGRGAIGGVDALRNGSSFDLRGVPFVEAEHEPHVWG